MNGRHWGPVDCGVSTEYIHILAGNSKDESRGSFLVVNNNGGFMLSIMYVFQWANRKQLGTCTITMYPFRVCNVLKVENEEHRYIFISQNML